MISQVVRRSPRGVMSLFGQKGATSSALFAAAPSVASVEKSGVLAPSRAQTSLLGGVRHAGASALACGIATVAMGGVAQGVGSVFAALVVGTARNPAIKDDLFAYTMIGFGMVELTMFIVILFAGALMTSE